MPNVEDSFNSTPCDEFLASLAESPQHKSEIYVPELLAQYKGQYILLSSENGLMLVHQRRAHIRVLFEKFRKQLYDKRGAIQGLLFPERIELSVAESLTLDYIMEELSYLGFDISSLGHGSYAIQGVRRGSMGSNRPRCSPKLFTLL